MSCICKIKTSMTTSDFNNRIFNNHVGYRVQVKDNHLIWVQVMELICTVVLLLNPWFKYLPE